MYITVVPVHCHGHMVLVLGLGGGGWLYGQLEMCSHFVCQ